MVSAAVVKVKSFNRLVRGALFILLPLSISLGASFSLFDDDKLVELARRSQRSSFDFIATFIMLLPKKQLLCGRVVFISETAGATGTPTVYRIISTSFRQCSDLVVHLNYCLSHLASVQFYFAAQLFCELILFLRCFSEMGSSTQRTPYLDHGSLKTPHPGPNSKFPQEPKPDS